MCHHVREKPGKVMELKGQGNVGDFVNYVKPVDGLAISILDDDMSVLNAV